MNICDGDKAPKKKPYFIAGHLYMFRNNPEKLRLCVEEDRTRELLALYDINNGSIVSKNLSEIGTTQTSPINTV